MVCLSTVLKFQVKNWLENHRFTDKPANNSFLLVLVTQLLRPIAWLELVVLAQELQPNTNKPLLHVNVMISN
jgi:hypothetical protein